jgi:hypothetical protein
VAGDFSPQTIDGARPQGRIAPHALLIAVAMGLGTMDMPVPAIAEWGWSNWKFPRPVRAGETVYARWTLTQKRPTKPGDATGVAVWRVDVHTADGAMCAEGEVGATVLRSGRPPAPVASPAAAAAGAGPSRRRRGRKSPAKPAAPAVVEAPPKPAEPVATAQPEKTGSSRRRRRRRPKSAHGGNGGNGGNGAAGESAPEPAPAPVVTAAAQPTPATGGQAASPLSRVIKRLRSPRRG